MIENQYTSNRVKSMENIREIGDDNNINASQTRLTPGLITGSRANIGSSLKYWQCSKVFPISYQSKKKFLIFKKSQKIRDFENYFIAYLKMLRIIFTINQEDIIDEFKAFGLTRDFLIKVNELPLNNRLKHQFNKILHECLFDAIFSFSDLKIDNLELNKKVFQTRSFIIFVKL